MITVERDVLSLGQTKKYGLNLGALPLPYLTAPDGTATTISGTPTVAGIGCTATYNSNSEGIVYLTVAAAANAAKGARALAQATIVLANGEVVPVQIELQYE